jgi:phage/plasmid-like protein (TIGR03299 family)
MDEKLEMFAGRNEPAWHGLGTVFTEPLTMAEAVRVARLDYKVTLEDIYVQVADGAFLIEGKKSITRHPMYNRDGSILEDEYHSFGIVSENYGLLDNTWIAERMDWLVDDQWTVETAGALGKGDTMFATLLLGEFELPNGDHTKQYLLIRDGKTGKNKFKMAVVNLRVVCQNTLIAAESSASVEAEFVHNQDIKEDLDFRIKFLESLKHAQEGTVQGLVKMLDTAMNTDKMKLILEHIYPYPSRPARAKLTDEYTLETVPEEYHEFFRKAQKSQSNYKYFINRADKLRGTAEQLFGKFNDENVSSANTGYALYQAVTESADWRNFNNAEVRSQGLLEDALFGSRAKEKAMAWTEVLKVK